MTTVSPNETQWYELQVNFKDYPRVRLIIEGSAVTFSTHMWLDEQNAEVSKTPIDRPERDPRPAWERELARAIVATAMKKMGVTT